MQIKDPCTKFYIDHSNSPAMAWRVAAGSLSSLTSFSSLAPALSWVERFLLLCGGQALVL